MKRSGWLYLGILYLAAITASWAADGRRVALVIGNTGYTGLPPLPRAGDDARLVATALSNVGFEVTFVGNFKMPDFLTTYEAPFLKNLKPGDVCFVYFSGYALQVVDEDNYLLPINFNPSDDREMQDRAYRLRRLQNGLEDRKLQIKIFALEAPPLLMGPVKGAVPSQGLMTPNLADSRETLFAFATQPGQTVPPGKGFFTQFLVENLKMPGMQAGDLFQAVKRDVGRETGGQQIPYVNDNIVTGNFFFRAPEKTKPPEPIYIDRVKKEIESRLPARNRQDNEEYVWITGGKFKVGCVPADTKCKPEEKPQHEVVITKGFWLGRNEVRISSYDRFLDDSKRAKHKKYKKPQAPLYNPRWSKSDLPMVLVSWEDARDFCQWAGGRLPTEAEWEFAARAGKSDEVYPLNDENSRDKANFNKKKGNDRWDAAAPVRSFDPNAFGLFDMAGNVWEWVWDFYSPDYYSHSPGLDPPGPESGKKHVIRGGSFDSLPDEHLRLSFRTESTGGNNVGFRCVLEDNPRSNSLLGLPQGAQPR